MRGNRPPWVTKPTDRFLLRWIKERLAARITPKVATVTWIRPWTVTLASAGLGVLGGVAFALCTPFGAAVAILASQVLDGVDGQLARLRGEDSPWGAFLDSVMDRYSDGAVLVGLSIGVWRTLQSVPDWVVLCVSVSALIGSGLISYTKARARELGLDLGAPTLASKGTRFSAMALGGLLSPILPEGPALALLYLALHTQGAVLLSLLRTRKGHGF